MVSTRLSKNQNRFIWLDLDESIESQSKEARKKQQVHESNTATLTDRREPEKNGKK